MSTHGEIIILKVFKVTTLVTDEGISYCYIVIRPRGGQTFLLAGQISRQIFIAGHNFFIFELCFHILSF